MIVRTRKSTPRMVAIKVATQVAAGIIGAAAGLAIVTAFQYWMSR